MKDSKTSFFILGCGRSGTSMVAGMFRNTGLFMGDNLHQPSWENPKGYFEDATINQLNNKILSKYLPTQKIIDSIPYQCDSPADSNGWLARIPLETKLQATALEQDSIQSIIKNQPFCIKDTRLCYLLPIWKKTIKCKIICVFRSPEIVIESILKSCRTRPGLADMAISVNQAFQIWELMYSHVLNSFDSTTEWFFVYYNDIVNTKALSELQSFAGLPLDLNFPDTTLNRTTSQLIAPDSCKKIFNELMALTTYDTSN